MVVSIPLDIHASFSDEYYSEQQQYLSLVDYYSFVPSIVGLRGDNVIVAVIDDGVWQEHPDLSHSSWINIKEIPGDNIDNDNNGYVDDYYGWNFIDNNSNMAPKGSHGTFVAGIISAAHNEIGIVGIAPQAKIMSLIVCDSGCGRSSVGKAIRYATDNGAGVINLSLGSEGYLGYSSEYDDAIQYAYSKDVVLVAAAGNGDPSGAGTVGQNLDFVKVSPVSNDVHGINTVLGVGALKRKERAQTSWSNYGKYVDVWAPGERIFSTSVPMYEDGDSYTYKSGTSFSAPIVSATVALMRGKQGSLKNYQVIDMILQSDLSYLNVRDLIGKIYGGSCSIFKVDATVYNGEKLILKGEHFTPRLSLRLDGTHINSGVTILDANNLEIDFKKINIEEGIHDLYTIDGNLYCQLNNISVEVLKNTKPKVKEITPTVTKPKVVVKEKPEEAEEAVEYQEEILAEETEYPINYVLVDAEESTEESTEELTEEFIEELNIDIEKIFETSDGLIFSADKLKGITYIDDKVLLNTATIGLIGVTAQDAISRLESPEAILFVRLTVEKGRTVYKVTTSKKVTIFGLFPHTMERVVTVDANSSDTKLKGEKRFWDFIYRVR